jgi:hypothetical protein
MNTFDVSKRTVSTYEQFLKDRKKAEDAKHSEKGENDIVKKSMSGDKKGDKGIETLEESQGMNRETGMGKEILHALTLILTIKPEMTFVSIMYNAGVILQSTRSMEDVDDDQDVLVKLKRYVIFLKDSLK